MWLVGTSIKYFLFHPLLLPCGHEMDTVPDGREQDDNPDLGEGEWAILGQVLVILLYGRSRMRNTEYLTR